MGFIAKPLHAHEAAQFLYRLLDFVFQRGVPVLPAARPRPSRIA